mmetsp:Transcript_4916/g.6878  ORF Transcript_4916/g.6878 Transcript_4916/m.6878 type:complete len:131 (+) Transcript_4916:120-512(+)
MQNWKHNTTPDVVHLPNHLQEGHLEDDPGPGLEEEAEAGREVAREKEVGTENRGLGQDQDQELATKIETHTKHAHGHAKDVADHLLRRELRKIKHLKNQRQLNEKRQSQTHLLHLLCHHRQRTQKSLCWI